MSFVKVIFIIITIVSPYQATAKEPELGELIGGVALGTQWVQPSLADSKVYFDETRAPLKFAVGMLAGLNSWFVADISISYGSSEFVRRSPTDQPISQRSNRIKIPVLMRYYPVFFFSVAGGFYASYKVGDARGPDGLTESQRTSATDTGEHGVEVSIAWDSPTFSEDFSITFDLRSSYSLTPQNREARYFYSGYIWLRKSI